jgi:hypothetical protein
MEAPEAFLLRRLQGIAFLPAEVGDGGYRGRTVVTENLQDLPLCQGLQGISGFNQSIGTDEATNINGLGSFGCVDTLSFPR